MMSRLIDAAIYHARTVLAILVLLLLAGSYSYIALPKEADPDIDIPTLYIVLALQGISPEDSVRQLAKPIERELKGLEGLKEIRSYGYQGGGYVMAEFEVGSDVEARLNDVRERIDRARPELPEDAEEPRVYEINLSLFPVVIVTLSGDVPERTLQLLADGLQDAVEVIPNVLSTNIGGDREEVIELLIEPRALEAYELDAVQIVQIMQRSNRLVAAGSLEQGEGLFPVKVPGLFNSISDIMRTPIKTDGDASVLFGDVARPLQTFRDTESFARINGDTAVSVEVKKRIGANIVETIEQVRAVVDYVTADWPEAVEIGFSQDRSATIRIMLADLESNVVFAILLVMVVVVAALGLRSGALVGIAIPTSFLTGLLVIYLTGLTINIVVLFSLILSVGMLVDGAIIVVELANRRLEQGADGRVAFGFAAKRMAWPIISSTATTLAAFLPLLFWPGIVGDFMIYLPITLLATLSASLVVALIFVPTLGAVLIRGRRVESDSRGLVVRDERFEPLPASVDDNPEDLDRLPEQRGLYVRILEWALRRPLLIVLASITVLVGVQWSYATYGRGIEFFPEVEPDGAVLQIHARGALSLPERDRLVRQVEDEILALHRERQEFHTVYAVSLGENSKNENSAEDVIGDIYLEFVDWNRRRPADVILADIIERSQHLGGIQIESRKQEAGPANGKAIQVIVSSDLPDLVRPAAERVVEGMRQIPGIISLDPGVPLTGVEWIVTIDRDKAARFGADVALIGNYIRLVTNGLKIDEYQPVWSDEELDILARLPKGARSLDSLDRLRINTDFGPVPISNFIERKPAQSSPLIRRINGKRATKIQADVAPGLLADDNVKEIQKWVETQDLDPRVQIRYAGDNEEQNEARSFLIKAFIVAVFLIAIILVTQFNSFYQAFLILSAIIMSTIGAMIGLLVTDQPFGIVMSGIGVVALAGIVVNNNIVLIDTFNIVRRRVPDPMTALVITGSQRLRPVMLTTVTTILGLMPMALGVNVDFIQREVVVGAPSTQWWRQLSTVIVFGLGFSTILTLVVTPCALLLWEKLRGQGRVSPDAIALGHGEDKKPEIEGKEPGLIGAAE